MDTYFPFQMLFSKPDGAFAVVPSPESLSTTPLPTLPPCAPTYTSLSPSATILHIMAFLH